MYGLKINGNFVLAIIIAFCVALFSKNDSITLLGQLSITLRIQLVTSEVRVIKGNEAIIKVDNMAE